MSGQGRSHSPIPDPPEHVIFERDDFENRVGMTYCRRCGRPVVNDRYPEKVTKHPCEVVRIDLRAESAPARDAS